MGALVLVVFLVGVTGSLMVSAGLLALFSVFLFWQLRRVKKPAPVHYCRHCGETLNRHARECRHCGGASWSAREE